MTVDPGGDGSGCQGVSGLGQYCPGDAGEDVAAPGGGENGRAGGTHHRLAVRRGDHGWDAFEDHGRASPCGDPGADLETTLEHVLNRRPGQPRELRGMWGEERGSAAQRT